jgi:hypothetical protein
VVVVVDFVVVVVVVVLAAGSLPAGAGAADPLVATFTNFKVMRSLSPMAAYLS